MIWDTWISRQIQIAAQLMDKVGRAPKDRLCRKDLGFSEYSLPCFLHSVLSLLEHIMEVSSKFYSF